MKALCSIGSGPHEALLAISRPTFAAYAERHGYELITSTEGITGRPPAWAKVPMLREAVDRYELVLWIDADAVIVDGSEDIADLVDRDLALVRHSHGGEPVPNTGVMVLRGGDFARSLLDRVWAAKRYVHHPWWENAALLDVLGYGLPTALEPRRRRLGRPSRPLRRARESRFFDGTRFLPLEWNSGYLDRAERPRIVHCIGVPVEQRLRDMQAALA